MEISFYIYRYRIKNKILYNQYKQETKRTIEIVQGGAKQWHIYLRKKYTHNSNDSFIN